MRLNSDPWPRSRFEMESSSRERSTGPRILKGRCPSFSLFEIMPEGSSVLLAQDFMRARYRDSLRKEKLVKSGEINRYEFKSFNWFSRRVSKGSRLRLLLKSPNSYSLQKN